LVALGSVDDPARAGQLDETDLGSSFSSWANSADYQCTRDKTGTAVCRAVSVIGLALHGVVLRGVELYFEEHRLARICRLIDEADFLPLRYKLLEQRGSAVDYSELLKAGMGGSFKNEIWVWEEASLVTMLEQFHERISTSSLCLAQRVAFERLMHAREARRIRGVRDL
jgi:hypothetical protein